MNPAVSLLEGIAHHQSDPAMRYLPLLLLVSVGVSAKPPETPVDIVATPVKSARIWTQAVAPNPRQGFNYMVAGYVALPPDARHPMILSF